MKAILATQFDAFDKGTWSLSMWRKPLQSVKILGPMTHSQLHSLLGEGVFNSDGISILMFSYPSTDHD